MPSHEERIKDPQQRLHEREREEREEREREAREQDQRLPSAGERARLETLANPRPPGQQPAAEVVFG